MAGGKTHIVHKRKAAASPFLALYQWRVGPEVPALMGPLPTIPAGSVAGIAIRLEVL